MNMAAELERALIRTALNEVALERPQKRLSKLFRKQYLPQGSDLKSVAALRSWADHRNEEIDAEEWE